MKKGLIITGTIIAVILIAALAVLEPFYRMFMTYETVRIDPQLTVYLGGGGNSIVLTSEDGSKALIVDTKMFGNAKKMKETIKAGDITIVNTHFHSDHAGGNDLYPAAKIIAGAYNREQWESAMGKSRYPDITVKPGEEKILKIGTETVHVRNMGRAHTWNDVVVYCENRKLLVTGDIVFLKIHPVLRESDGSSVKSWIGVLDDLMKRYTVKILVPGHGKISGQQELPEMKDYFTSVRDAAGDPVKLKALEVKDKDYFHLPFMSGLDRTAAFIEREKRVK
jgi:cyclase